MADTGSTGRTEQRARFRRRVQEFAAQGCPRCRGAKVQVAEPARASYDHRHEVSCVDCGEMWWTE